MSMDAVQTRAGRFDVEDIEYLRHGDKPLFIRCYRPHGPGPFPVMIELLGGVWTENDRTRGSVHHEAFANNGIAVASLDFRQGPAGYPNSVADINYAIRFVKANAARFNSRPDLVGISGTSSGGHLAMLAAMRPNDPRYAAIPLPAGSPNVDATVRSVAMAWPVINPLSRYRNAVRERAKGTAWVGDIPERQGSFWKNDENMIDGNPILMLERGEKVPMPPALWVQGRPDPVHDYRDPESPVAMNEPERFAANYRKAGGTIELLYIDQAARQTNASHDPIAAFFLKTLPVEREVRTAA